MAEKMTMITKKCVLIPERSDSLLWERRVYDFTVKDYEQRISFYESQLESKNKEVKRNAKIRLEILNKELDAFLDNPEITQKVINNYTYGLVRTAMSEEAARKNYIIEYVKSILIAEHAYAMDFRDRNKRISQILQYAYRKKGSSKGSLFVKPVVDHLHFRFAGTPVADAESI